MSSKNKISRKATRVLVKDTEMKMKFNVKNTRSFKSIKGFTTSYHFSGGLAIYKTFLAGLTLTYGDSSYSCRTDKHILNVARRLIKKYEHGVSIDEKAKCRKAEETICKKK